MSAMTRHSRIPALAVFCALGVAGTANAQFVLTYNSTADTIAAFSPIDGSLQNANVFPVATTTAQVSTIEVNGEIWVSEQTGDRVVRYSSTGSVLGVIGPTFAGGGFDNIRGMALIGGVVYVTNDGANNGATADSLVLLDTAGNHLSTVALTNTVSPYSVIPWQGDILVAGSGNLQDVHRYTLAGASVGTFSDTSLSFIHQIAPASDGNVWAAVFTTNVIAKLDATTGAVLSTFPASGARGVYELQNGNVLWSGSGVFVYDVATATSTQVLAGSSYHFSVGLTTTANHQAFGLGCHDFENRSNVMQFFPDVPAAKATLDGNALQFTLTANGYVWSWLPGAAGALYVPPSGTATIVANVSTGQETFTPSAPIPIPGGTTATWTVSSEGILTAGSTGNQGTDTTPTLAETAAATGLAFYTWCTQNPTETGSGKVKWEEVGGVLYVTFEGVEFSGGTPTLAPSTYQWQVNMTTGNVTMLWTSFSASSATTDVLVGCTLAGAGQTPLSTILPAVGANQIGPDVPMTPMTLSAAPAPVINPSTLVTYTIGNIPETSPGSGLYLSTLFLSVNPLPGGFDLANVALTTVPGCRLYIATLDVNIGTAITFAPSSTVQVTFSTPLFAPGNVIGAQAVALFDAAFPLPNGESGGLLLSNGVYSMTHLQ